MVIEVKNLLVLPFSAIPITLFKLITVLGTFHTWPFAVATVGTLGFLLITARRFRK